MVREKLLSYPLHPNISIYILYTSLYVSFGTFKENLFNNPNFLGGWSFSLFSWSQWMI